MVLLQLSLLVAFFLNVQTNEVGCIKRRLIKTAAYLRVHDGPIVLSYRASTKDGTTIRVCNGESRTGIIIGGGIGDNDNDNGASRLPRAVREAACRLGTSIIEVAWNPKTNLDPPGAGFRPTRESQLERGESRYRDAHPRIFTHVPTTPRAGPPTSNAPAETHHGTEESAQRRPRLLPVGLGLL
jgi:hypothetical protein